MMLLSIDIKNVQHIRDLRFELDLSRNGLMCVVGKNGVGKTTLIKSFRNLKYADTFLKMAQPGAIRPNSSISYKYGDACYDYVYDSSVNSLDSREVIPSELKKAIEVELPMPWGQRFNTYQSISSADKDIRTAVMLQDYSSPNELIALMNDVYQDDKFNMLKEVSVGRSKFYIIPLEDDRYVREDHLSSGEFFLISLYRKIQGVSRLIVIDEIDISLDAAAQSRLVDWLRKFCTRCNMNIMFTTHSMAIMRTMREGELHYIYHEGPVIKTLPVSYNFIKAVLFGFEGWDRYILTEDPMLEGFFKFLIATHGISNFYSFKIIPVGGGDNVVQLLAKNARERFLSTAENVIAILDGDYEGTRNGRKKNTFCIPFPSIEKKVFSDYQSGLYKLDKKLELEPEDNKQFRKAIKKYNNVSDQDLYIYLNDNYKPEVERICEVLRGFIGRSNA